MQTGWLTWASAILFMSLFNIVKIILYFIGGVLGLFTGMSLLSIAELVVWAVKIAGEIFGERHRISQRKK